MTEEFEYFDIACAGCGDFIVVHRDSCDVFCDECKPPSTACSYCDTDDEYTARHGVCEDCVNYLRSLDDSE